MQSNGATAHALTDGDDIARISTKASILLRTPKCRTFVCAHNDVSDVHTLTIECSTLVSQAIVGLFRSYQCFSETEHYVPRLTIIKRVLVEVTQHTSQPVVDTNKDHWLTIRFACRTRPSG